MNITCNPITELIRRVSKMETEASSGSHGLQVTFMMSDYSMNKRRHIYITFLAMHNFTSYSLNFCLTFEAPHSQWRRYCVSCSFRFLEMGGEHG